MCINAFSKKPIHGILQKETLSGKIMQKMGTKSLVSDSFLHFVDRTKTTDPMKNIFVNTIFERDYQNSSKIIILFFFSQIQSPFKNTVRKNKPGK